MFYIFWFAGLVLGAGYFIRHLGSVGPLNWVAALISAFFSFFVVYFIRELLKQDEKESTGLQRFLIAFFMGILTMNAVGGSATFIL